MYYLLKDEKSRHGSTRKCNSPVPITDNGRVYINRLSLLVISNKPSIYMFMMLFGTLYFPQYTLFRFLLIAFSELLRLLEQQAK